MTVGEIVLLTFPFTELNATKKRPALLLRETKLTAKIALVTVAMITSKIEGTTIEGDVLLKEWKAAGLLHPSVVRLSKIATVEAEKVEKKLGKLAVTDQAQVKKVFQALYTQWIS